MGIASNLVPTTSGVLEFYPAALQSFPNQKHKAALVVLAAAPTPSRAGCSPDAASCRYCTAPDDATTTSWSSRSSPT